MIKSKFRITIPLCGLLLLSSCRTEELLHEVGQKEELSKKFIPFTKKHENDVIDYGEGFKSLALRYDSIHKTNMTGRADIAKLEEELQTNNKMSFSKSNEVAYIDFNVRSQLMEEENGDKWMVFPRVKGKEVVDLVMAILSEEETLLNYYTINKESELYKENISKFEEVYQKKQQKSWNVKGSSYTTFSMVERGIEPVDIIIRKPIKPIFVGIIIPILPPNLGEDIGRCPAYEMCVDPGREVGGGGGGGNSSNNDNKDKNKNPCAEMKAKNRSPLYQQKVNELNKHSVLRDRREHGYVEDRNGNFIELKPGKSTANSDSMTMPMEGIRGYVHTHQDEYETGKENDDGEPEIRKPIKMFSPRDVGAVMDIASLRTDGDYADIYGTMIASNGVYTIRFTGTKNDIKTGFSGKEWNDRYIDFMNIQGGSIETKFLRFMKEKMGVSGISLFKTEKNGTIKKYELNNKNKAEKSDCN